MIPKPDKDQTKAMACMDESLLSIQIQKLFKKTAAI